MTRVDDVARSLNTVGLAAWFGGSLMGAVALRGAGPGSGDTALEVENEAWRRWSPVQSAAIGAHLLGSAKMATTNKGRLVGQRGVGTVSLFKTVCTAGALGATFYAAKLGSEVHRELERGAAAEGPGATRGIAATEQLEAKLRKLRLAQAAVPALTGAMLVADSRLGEQQRPLEVLRGMASRAVPDSLQHLPESIQHLPETLHAGPALGAIGVAAKHLPEAAKHLPDAARHLPETVKGLPETARHLPDSARSLLS